MKKELSILLIAGLFPCCTILAAEPVEKAQFVYYFDNPAHIERADSALARVRLQMINLVHDSLPYKPAIYLLDNIDEFNKVIRGRIPDWGVAAAFPERRLIAVKSPDKFQVGKSLEELLAHEYSHLLLHHRTGLVRPPRWFDEGLAMLVSFEWGWEDNLAMSRAGTFGQFISLREIESMNRFGAPKAQLAYAQSYLAVEYFYREYGTNSVNRFLDAIRSGHSLDSAFSASVGGRYSEFEEEYKTYLKERYNIASLFMDTMLFWLFLAVIVIVAAFVRYKKRRQYYKKWDQEEKIQSKDFDYGSPDRPEQLDEEDESWRG
ncbi:MAG: peptidase MA family metallohydrolase [Candidatus Zixiibacteriota bacterium]